MPISIKTITKALTKAAFAPSSHNTQPWATIVLLDMTSRRAFCKKYNIDDFDDVLIVFGLHSEHILKMLPEYKVEMRLSLGAYIQIFTESLDSPYQPSFVWSKEHAESKVTDLEGWPQYFLPCVALKLSENGLVNDRKSYSEYIPSRRVHRFEYEKQALTASQINTLSSARSRLDPTNNYQLSTSIITDGNIIKGIGDLISTYGHLEYTVNSIWKQTYSYFRWSQDEGKHFGNGLAISQIVQPMNHFKAKLYKLLLSPSIMNILNKIGFAQSLAKSTAKNVSSSKSIYVLSFSTDTPSIKEQVIAGMFLGNFWLCAESLGLSLFPISIVLEHETCRQALQKLLQSEKRPFFIGKIGTAINRQKDYLRFKDPLNAMTVL